MRNNEKNVQAIYEHGVLRPLNPLEGIAENSEVELTIQSLPTRHALKDLFSTLPKEDADEMRKVVDQEFEKVDLSEW